MRTPDVIRLLSRIALFLPLAGGLILIDWAAALPPVRRLVMHDLNAAADALNAGQAVWGLGDLRDLRSAELLREPRAADVLILGSSRMVVVSADWFQPRSAFNAAMISGDLDDAVSVFQFCVDTRRLPKAVVMELNPCLSYEGDSQSPRLLAPYLRAAMWRYRLLPGRFFTGLLSLDGLRWDLRSLFVPTWHTSGTPTQSTSVVSPDGAFRRLGASTQADKAEAAAIWNMEHLDAAHSRWRTSSQPDSSDLKLLRRLLDDMQSRGIQITLMLPPVHPAAFGYYYRQGGYHEDWIRREAASRRIKVAGSFSPFVAHAAQADFFDDVHTSPALIRRLLAEAGVIPSAQ
jgi:hypothetical protein